MQRDLGTRRAVVIAHYWSRTALGGRDDQGADLLDCGLMRHRGVVLAPAAPDRAVGGASPRRPARARARGA
jgi:hypothetical protein